MYRPRFHRPHKTSHRKSLTSVAIVTTVMAPEKMISDFLDYHRVIGVSRAYLYLDDPDPIAMVRLRQKFGDWVTFLECDAAYWQSTHGVPRPTAVETRQRLNSQNAVRLAKENRDDWICHIDIDEYIYPDKVRLPELLNAIRESITVIRMPVLEAVPRRLELFQGVSELSYFKNAPFPISLGDKRYKIKTRLERGIVTLWQKFIFLALGRLLNLKPFRRGYWQYYNGHCQIPLNPLHC